MSASDAPAAASPAPIALRGRAKRIAHLRTGLLAFAALVFLLVIGWTVATAMRGPPEIAALPLQAVAPRMMGQDDRKRPFVITATRATREPGSTQKVDLERPMLVRDEGGPDALNVSAATGVYDEAAGKLTLSGGVRIDGARGQFSTPSTVYDTKSGNLAGEGAVQAESGFGRLRAGGFQAGDKGKSVIYKGGVRARINPR